MNAADVLGIAFGLLVLFMALAAAKLEEPGPKSPDLSAQILRAWQTMSAMAVPRGNPEPTLVGAPAHRAPASPGTGAGEPKAAPARIDGQGARP